MKPTYLFPLVLCWLLNIAVAETTVSVTAASQAATPTVSTQDLKTLELQFQEKMLDLRKETLDSQQETIAWWLGLIGVAISIIGLISVILPLAFYWRERSNMLENLKQAINEAKGHTDQAEKYLSEIKSQHRTAADYTAQIQQMRDYQSNSDNAAIQQAAVQAANDLQDNEQIPLAERLRAHAIVLSDQAKSYAEHEQAFYAWQAVIQHSPNDVDALFNAAYQAHEAYRQGNRLQQSAWLPHIKQGYQQVLELNPDDSATMNNLGNALNDEAQALAQNNHFDEAWKKWDEAYKQYDEALRIKTDHYQAANNWGLALDNEARALAQNKRLDEAWGKWNEAYTQYNKALSIKGNYYHAANNWGVALDSEARALAQNNHWDEAWDKWNQAYKQYDEALRIKTDYYQAANNWGVALNHEAQALAQNNRLNEAWKKWDKAYTQYKEALRIKPDFYLATYNCISSLIHTYHAQKQNQQDQAAQDKLQEAKKLAEDFIQNYPQHAAELAYNLARVYVLLGSSADKVVEQLKLAASADNFPSQSHIEQEKDFDGIRQSPAFQDWFKHTFPN